MLLECRGVAVDMRLAPFSADVGAGELIHLLGPNGAGKSSLLACLSGLLPISCGRITFSGLPLSGWPIRALARHRAWLHQQQLPTGRMPVWHYLQQHQVAALQNADETLMAFCQAFQLTDKLARPISQLSGGEWQRVRLTAVFCQIAQPEGELLLLDEPLAGLDLAQQAAFDRLLASMVAKGITAIVSGHDINHSLHHADRVWLMKNGEMVSQGSTDQVLQPDILTAAYEVPFRRLSCEGCKIITTLR